MISNGTMASNEASTYILGISAFYHDSAAVLIGDGEILSAVQEERFTREKYDHRFPKKSIRHCLERNDIEPEDLDYVAFYEKPFLKFERILYSFMEYAPVGLKAFLKAMPVWIKQKLWIKDIIRQEMEYDGKIRFPEHHESHAASAFFPSPFQEASVLTLDAVGEWSTTSYGSGSGNDLEILAEQRFPHSIGMLYSAFTYYTGFRVNSGEYKVMGLAPYGEPEYTDVIRDELIDLKEDGSFRLNMEYFNYGAGLTMTSGKFHDLFGGPRREPESELLQKDLNLARSIQEVTEDIIFRMARHVVDETGNEKLCLAGGVALNCVANGKLLREDWIDDLWIQPAAGDAGGALGAALSIWYQHLENERNADGEQDFQKGSFLGPEWNNDEIERYLDAREAPYTKLDEPELYEETADLIDGKNVVGWYQGRMEYGPRALGNRSILGDARDPDMQGIINRKIKFREGFRPFAPSILREKTAEYFDRDMDSPYMILIAWVREALRKELSEEEKNKTGLDKLDVDRSEVPAITHVDYTSRLQTVHEETNPEYHQLLSALDERHDCPIVVNTSLNLRGEPIVCSPEDAYLCFMRSDMDYIVMGNYLLDKEKQDQLDEDFDLEEEFGLD